MSESDNVAVVQRVYASLDDDFSAFLELFASDVEWQYPEATGLPYGGLRHGQEGVAEFFELHEAADEIVELSPRQFIAQGDRVVVLGHYRGRPRATGREWESDFVHVFRVRGGKIQRLEAYFNTAGFVEANRPAR